MSGDRVRKPANRLASLAVDPVAGLRQETLDAGGEAAVVNRGPTWVDGRAVAAIDGKAGDVLGATLAALR